LILIHSLFDRVINDAILTIIEDVAHNIQSTSKYKL